MKCPHCGESLAINVERSITVNDYCSQEIELEWDAGKGTWTLGSSTLLDCNAGETIEQDFEVKALCCNGFLDDDQLAALGFDSAELDALPWG